MKKSSISRFNNNLSTMFIVDESNNEIKAYELEPEYRELTGGGSSDFTTATLSVKNETSYDANLSAPLYTDIEGFAGSGGLIFMEPSLDESANVILYKDVATAYIQLTNANQEVAISGDITDNDGVLTITGDASITVRSK